MAHSARVVRATNCSRAPSANAITVMTLVLLRYRFLVLKIAKPLLSVSTPIGVGWGVVEAYRFHPWLALDAGATCHRRWLDDLHRASDSPRTPSGAWPTLSLNLVFFS